MAYDNTNTGMMYRNDKKESDSHPDFTGFIDIEGEEYWLSAWVKEGKKGKLEGKKFFSLAFKPKEQRQTAPTKGRGRDTDDDIPF